MITVSGVSKRFGRTLAVDDISFEVARGEVLGLLGPNGAGKTTTMRILSCYLGADTGSASVAGFDVATEPLEVRRRLGYLPENNPLYPEMTVREYLELVAAVRGVPRGDVPRRIGHAVESCALGQVAGRIIGQLSKGYRQPVGLAGALLHDPEILILDEPTVGLDPSQINEIRELISGIGLRTRPGASSISSHRPPEVPCLQPIRTTSGACTAPLATTGTTGGASGSSTTPALTASAGRGLQALDGVLPGAAAEMAEMEEGPGLVRAHFEVSPASLGSLSIGSPDAGLLLNPIAFPEGPLWKIRNPVETYATAETIAFITSAIEAVEGQFPGGPRLVIGDISRADGGRLNRHRSHQSGRDADVGFYFRSGEASDFARGQPKNLDVARTWAVLSIRKTEPGEKAGDLFVDTNKSMEKYREWLAMTRPADKAQP